jgi:hypothetical protein
VIEVDIVVPASDVAALQETLQKYAAWFSKGPKEAIKKACVYIVRSLSASTKISAKTRRVVRNPQYAKAGSKRARQLMHIADWNKEHGKPYRMPNTYQKWAIQRLTQRGSIYHKPVNGDTHSEALTSARQSDVFKPYSFTLRRRGLAKSSWGWMLGKIGKKGAAPSVAMIAERAGLTQVTESPETALFQYVEMTNKLSYIRKATKPNVGSIMARANRAIIDEMEGHSKRAKAAAGLRAA